MQPLIERRRRSLRLKWFDYSSPGNYFVTICTHDHAELFGEVGGGQMVLNLAGEAVRAAWFELPARFPSVVPDVFVVMPNHFHGIVTLTEPIPRSALGNIGEGLPGNFTPGTRIQGAASTRPYDKTVASQIVREHENCGARSECRNYEYPTLGRVMRAFKSVVAIAVNRALGRFGMPVWQRNYFERVVRNGREYERIRKYIVENPIRWEEDGWDAMPTFEGDGVTRAGTEKGRSKRPYDLDR